MKIKILFPLLITALLLTACTKTEISRGTITDNTYTSEYASLSAVLPEGCTVQSDEALAALIGETAESVYPSGSSFAAQAAARESIFDMQAVSADGSESIGFYYENLASEEMNGADEAQYLQLLASQLRLLDANAELSELREITLGGETWLCLSAELTYSDTPISQSYAAIKLGDYMAVLLASSLSGDSQALLDIFI